MRFIDSNIFLHAYLTPRRALTRAEQTVKDEAKAVVKRVEEGEEVATTVVHVSEVVNVIETGLGIQESLGFLAWIIASENVKVYPVSPKDYANTLLIAREKDISVNDALAYLFMKAHGIKEIYSFDKHFKKLEDIITLPKI
ncbi:MAG: type II toxin-antitoxin system VapC family toxin [Candidatus Bathyarchaeia archaeon]